LLIDPLCRPRSPEARDRMSRREPRSPPRGDRHSGNRHADCRLLGTAADGSAERSVPSEASG
jgi:hypothetical protein